MEGSLKAPKVRQHRDAVSAGVIMSRREVAEQKGFRDIHVKKTIPKSEFLLVISPQKDLLPVTENEVEGKIK